MNILLTFEGTSEEIPPEFVMFKLCEKFGWTEEQILNTSYNFIIAVLKIMKIESDYIKWQNEKNGNSR